MDSDVHDIGKPLSLTNTLFLEEPLDQASISNILEEDFTSQHNSLDNTQYITTQFANIPNITEHVSTTAIDETNPHTNEDKLSPIVTQIQTGINDSYADSDDEESPITGSSDRNQFDQISKQLNNIFDATNDYLSAELKAIINHRYSNSAR